MKNIAEDTQQYRDLDYTQFAYKTLLNSSYGYYAFAGARWYCRECAAATAALGREYIQQAMEIAEEHGLDIVYGDTDSAILTHSDIHGVADEYAEAVNDELPRFMELELEGFFTRGLFTEKASGEGAKKRYALLSEDGDMKITGFEQVRRDWSKVAKHTQKTVIDHVLHDDVDGAVTAVKDTIQHIRDKELALKQFIIYTTLTKQPEKYESTAPHVEAAKKAEQAGGYDISPGQTIRYVVTPGASSISDRARVADEAETYDAEYYIENQVVPAAIRILSVFDYTAEDLLEKGTQRGLGEFT
jgi:DNA polymerase Pol2